MREAESLERSARVIRAARKKMGLTQTELAGRLGLSQSTVSKLEAGKLMPTALVWIDLCDQAKLDFRSLSTGIVSDASSKS